MALSKEHKRELTRQVYAALDMFRAVLTGEVPICGEGTHESASETRSFLLLELQEQRNAMHAITDAFTK